MTPQQPAQQARPAAAPLNGLSLVDTCRFRLRTPAEAEAVAMAAAGMFRDPARAMMGLHALMLNAIEHGCLGIGHTFKNRLVEGGTWDEEAARRLSLPDNRAKRIELVVSRKDEGVYAVVTDPGEGFDWRTWLSVDPARAGSLTGRGIAHARSACFDGLSYNDKGNQAVAFERNGPGLVW